jgi:hypothetical protein
LNARIKKKFWQFRMAFIDINDRTGIGNLGPGEFALPTMDGLPIQPLADTDRLRRSIRAMKTLMQNQNLGDIAALIPETHDGHLPERMNLLESAIVNEMTTYLENPTPATLASIFHQVQLWGGKAGRNIYVRDGGFAANWNEQSYRHLAVASSTPVHEPGSDPRVPLLIAAADQIQYFGVSFATKHARFWAQAGGVKPLPIYDRTVAQGSMGINAGWNLYGRYVSEMTAHALEAHTDVATLERHAFNAFGTPAGQAWINARGI